MSMKRIITSFFRYIWIIPANYALTYVVYYSVVYLLIPNLGVLIHPIRDYFIALEQTSNGTQWALQIIIEICGYITIFPAVCISFCLSRSTRKAFINDKQYFETYKESLKYHIRKYKYDDLAMIGFLCLLNFLGFLINHGRAIYPFVTAAYHFPIMIFGSSLGLVIGTFIFITTISLAVILAIFVAQRKWRAVHLLW